MHTDIQSSEKCREKRTRKKTGVSRSKTVALLGMLTALSMILSYIDSQVPLLPSVPGIRLGLANTVTLFLLYSVSGSAAFLVTVVRVILCGVLFYGNAYHIAYGLSGAVAAFSVMILLKKSSLFSPCGVSVGGGVIHNTAQLICAVALTNTPQLAYYLPLLLISGAVSGACVGMIGSSIIRRIMPDRC